MRPESSSHSEILCGSRFGGSWNVLDTENCDNCSKDLNVSKSKGDTKVLLFIRTANLLGDPEMTFSSTLLRVRLVLRYNGEASQGLVECIYLS